MVSVALALAVLAVDPSPLLEADRALDQAVARHDAAAFAALVDEDALFADRGGLRAGRAEVARAWAPFLAEGGPRLRWIPREGTLARSGELGFTIGTWRFERAKEGGALDVAEGRYVTVWRIGKDGRFRAVLDSSLSPDPSPSARRAVVRTLRSRAGDLEASAGTWEGPDGTRGTFLSIRVHGPGGALAPAIETFVPSSGGGSSRRSPRRRKVRQAAAA